MLKKIEILLTLALLAGSVAIYGGYFVPQTVKAVEAQAVSENRSSTSYQTSLVTTSLVTTSLVTTSLVTTSLVTRGEIAQTASGNGALVAVQSASLGFGVSGTVSQLNVALGDTVKAGQVLAVLDSIPELQQAVADNQLALLSAQKALDELKTGAEGSLAQALADQSSAEAALSAAKNGLHDPHDWRCPDATTAKYYEQYLNAKMAAQPWQNRLGDNNPSDRNYVLMNLKPILKKMDQAFQNYTYCQAYTPSEIIHSQADLQSAQANLAKAQRVYQDLQANQGIEPLDQAIAQARFQNAQLQLRRSQENLDGATLKAPYDGKITVLSTAPGQAASQAVMTIAQVDPLQLQASIDEADLSSVAAGCPVSATFTALPGQTVKGTVAWIYPSLVTVSNVKSVQLLVDLASGPLTQNPLPIGAGASLQVTCAQAQNALLVPVQALHLDGTGASFVYVLNASGKPEKRAVKTGIQTGVAAEILSGLQIGEQVITSAVGGE